MDRKRKRQFDTDLAPIVKKRKVLKVESTRATGKQWSELSELAQSRPATVFKHKFTVNDERKSIHTTHTHGAFNTSLTSSGGSFQLSKFNISTATVEGGAKTLDDLVGAFGSRRTGATNTMRVLKGKETQWALMGTNETRASRAVELAAEIGISEYSRGGTHALVNAMSGLYLMKHRQMTKDQFLDHKIGYRGAGKGGAERLRSLQKKGLSEALHLDRLRTHYDNYAVNKPSKAWSGQKSDDGFLSWTKHKVTNWTGRQ